MEILAVKKHNNSNDGYEQFIRSVIDNRAEGRHVFTTNCSGNALWDAYIQNIPEYARNHYNCNSCRHFIQRYGGLVTIEDDGQKTPVFWIEMEDSDFFSIATSAMLKLISKSKINGVFFDDNAVLGTDRNYSEKHGCYFHHFHAPNNFKNSRAFGYQSAYQKHADSKERFKMLVDCLFYGYDEKTANIAAEVVKEFSGGDKTSAWANWYRDLYAVRKNINLVWAAMASAPNGWAHVRASVLGALMDDIKSGMSLDNAKHRFEEKMDPLKYQRPQTDPSDSNIEQAEKLIEQMGISDSLKRRYATVEEIEKIWTAKNEEVPVGDGSVLGHLKKDEKKISANMRSVIKITWEKFLSTVLPGAEKMWFRATKNEPFGAITAPVVPDSKCIMKWGNNFAWFIRSSDSFLGRKYSPPENWGCSQETEVIALSYVPSKWDVTSTALDYMSVFIILDGCTDKHGPAELALFPECLISELHSVRKTIEAYSNSKQLEIPDGDLACGVMIGSTGMQNGSYLIIESNGVKKRYFVDRWE